MAEPHEVLDVSPEADEQRIRSAYRERLKEHHPDHGGSAEQFRRVQRAYEHIVDDEPDALRPQTVCAAELRDAQPAERAGEVGLLARGDGLEVHLVALTDRVDVAALLPEHVEDGRRFVACFDVGCRADDPVTWEGRRVRFVDDGGERHLPSVYRPRSEDLPGAWRGGDVDLAPAERVRALLVSRVVPDDATIDRLTYDDGACVGGDRGLRFDLDDERRTLLDEDPLEE